jgi:hypothetical protein
MIKQLYELCYGVEPEERDLLLLEIKYQRLLDNGFSNEEARKILIDTKLNIEEYEYTDSIIYTEEDTVYRHHQLQIHSKPGGFDPATCTIIKSPYYLEMKQRYTMNSLLDYYYTKLLVPIDFRDEKRDIGAFKHLISFYKFSNISSVDFILFVIDYMASNEYKTTNPLDIKNYAQATYEYLEQFVLHAKLELVNREDVLINEM